MDSSPKIEYLLNSIYSATLVPKLFEYFLDTKAILKNAANQ